MFYLVEIVFGLRGYFRDVDNDKGDLEVNRLNLKGGGSASKVSLNVIEEPLNMYNNVRRGNCPKPTIFFKDNIRCVLQS